MQVARRGNQPKDYSPAIGEEICAQMVRGLSLPKICQSAEMPSESTVYKWLNLHEEFAELYARAQQDRSHFLFEDALAKADDPDIPPEHKRIMVDTRKWAAAKLNPRKYGDRIQHEHSGTITLAGVLAAVDEPLTIEGKVEDAD